MRIIGGSLRGRRIEAPRGFQVRPSSDRLRETLFNILGPGVAGRAFLDAFAGSGAVGLEAYSRGARPVRWIESDAAAARQLRVNLERLGVEAGRVWERSVAHALGARAAAAGAFDYVFLDPPYDDHDAYATALRALDRHPAWLRAGARVIVETRRRGGPALAPMTRLRLEREHAVGDSVLWFFAAE